MKLIQQILMNALMDQTTVMEMLNAQTTLVASFAHAKLDTVEMVLIVSVIEILPFICT